MTVDIPEYQIEKDDLVLSEKIEAGNVTVFFLRLNKDFLMSSKYLKRVHLDKTGDQFQMKICDRCYKLLDVEEFENNRIKKGGKITKRPSCRKCRKEKNGVNMSTKDKNFWYKKRDSLNGKLYKCPICEKTTIAGITNHVIDHNHRNGKVRGIICESCNTGLGRFDDNIEMLRKAIKWLQTH